MQIDWTVILAFVIYLGVMLTIGITYYKKSKTASDYFLGGRNLNSWVTAMSAQASDMSGWLLMGLPGAVYMFGTGQVWIGIGLAIGTYLNWRIVARRLRRYTYAAGNSITLPEFWQNRFDDKKGTLKIISSVIITIFFLVYTAAGFAAGGKLFSSVFGIEYTTALLIGVLVILTYTFLGGFMAVCWTDFIQGMLMLIALITVPIMAFYLVGGMNGINMLDPGFLDPLKDGGSQISLISIISQLGWALGYFGMPHILVRFMAIKSETLVRKSRIIAVIWVVITLSAAIFVGVVGKLYVSPALDASTSETVFIKMIMQMCPPFIAGILLCAILAAIMSTADSQLLVTASSVANDLYSGVINKKASSNLVLLVSRITVVGVAIIAFLIALDPNSSIMGLVSNAWAGFGSAFGPLMLFALFWKRINIQGAIAGMVSGGLVVIIWDYLPFGDKTLAGHTGLYSLVIGFAVSALLIYIVTLLTPEPNKAIVETYELVDSGKELEA